MLLKGWQYLATKRMRCGYEKLTNPTQKMMRIGRRCCWVKSMNGRLRGLRLSRSRKLSLVVLSSRIVRMCTEVVNRMNMENIYPTIVLPTQWGLPVLSHNSHLCRRKQGDSDASRPLLPAFFCRLWFYGKSGYGYDYGGGNGRCRLSPHHPILASLNHTNHVSNRCRNSEITVGKNHHKLLTEMGFEKP
ncbi:hypothetical protein VNO77_18212 [Canavalia gladiata]|uniref:Uncharacterized protein n=1 Tax=Canavalia gladiata TaxID=3824 RepID=A0AAN9LNR6_CANGL